MPEYESWYEEISLGLQRIRKTGSSYVIPIPKHFVENYRLKKGNHIHVILLKRHRTFNDEVADDSELVRMTQQEKIAFESWKKRREELGKSISTL